MSVNQRPTAVAGRILVFVGMLLPAGLSAQAKKPLDHSVYDKWNRITGQSLSDDGGWAAFTVVAEEVDGTLHVRNLKNDAEQRIARGEGARFTEDSRFLVFQIKPAKDAVKQAKKDKKKPDQMPADSLGILDLATGTVARFDRVQSFKVPEEAAGWVAYQLMKPAAAASDSTKPAAGAEAGRGGRAGGAGAAGAPDAKKKEEGTTLVVRNLATGQEQRIEDVTSYLFSRDGLR